MEVVPLPEPADRVPPVVPVEEPRAKMTRGETILVVMTVVASLNIARPVLLPVFLACMISMTLKPFITWLAGFGIHRAVSAAVVLLLVMAAVGVGVLELGRPAMKWVNSAPGRMTELRQRVQNIFPQIDRFSPAAAAVSNLGATEDEKRAEQTKTPTVELKENHGAGTILNWTGTFLVGVGETLVLAYLLLASGDLFLQKFVHAMPTMSDKKRAVEISREIQHNISHYLFSITLINLGLGLIVSAGLWYWGVPNPAMWGLLVAGLNFVPYFGPILGVALLAAVGLLAFDSPWQGLIPPGWYLLLHLLEANLITPVLLGRRFTLNAVVIFVSLIFWTWLWGVPGALLSVPILVSLKVVCDRVPSLNYVAELLADGSVRTETDKTP